MGGEHVRSTEELYQELLAAFAQQAGFTPEEGCDLAVRFGRLQHRFRHLASRRTGCWTRAFHRRRRASTWTATQLCGGLCACRRQSGGNPAVFCKTTAGSRHHSVGGNGLHDGSRNPVPKRPRQGAGGGNPVCGNPGRGVGGRHCGERGSGGDLHHDSVPVAITACTNPKAFPAAVIWRMTRPCAAGFWRAISGSPTAPTPRGTSRPP